jgi:geranylgeranyl diphosphate synthase, type II
MSFDIARYLKDRADLVDRTLAAVLPQQDCRPGRLHESMRYAVLGGGKRLRPVLAMAAAEAVGADSAAVLREACALELVHTYTLVHDDLPAMDDDDFRRGREATHKVYGEATAILAGDALQPLAFAVLASGAHSAEKKIEVIRLIAEACGSQGIVGGQMVDIESEGKHIDAADLDYIHRHKTGCLLRASVLLGAVLGGCSPEQYRRLSDYGEAIGLCFQITDDILDVLGTSAELGKPAGSDQVRGKATYPSINGMAASRIRQSELYSDAIAALDIFDDRAEPLREIARLIIERKK